MIIIGTAEVIIFIYDILLHFRLFPLVQNQWKSVLNWTTPSFVGHV